MEYVRLAYDVSERRGCSVLGFARSTHRYTSVADGQDMLRTRIRELSFSRPHYGYRRVHVMLLREGWEVNHKRTYRLYREEGLCMRRTKPRRRVSAARREQLPRPVKTNESWSMDFMSDQLYSGTSIRVLTIVDNFSRESLSLRVGRSLGAEQVVDELNRVTAARGVPRSIRVDNGTEFTSRLVDQWAYWNGVTLDFSRPGRPMDNGHIEAFNGRLRAECLNEHWFLSVADAQDRIEQWRVDYNSNRPHGALGYRTPLEVARSSGKPASLS